MVREQIIRARAVILDAKILRPKNRSVLCCLGEQQRCRAFARRTIIFWLVREREHSVSVFSKSERDEASGLNGGRVDFKPETKATNGKALPDTVSMLTQGVQVTGNIVSEGTLQIFGRVDGDIHASCLLVKKGAKVEGNIVAQETIIHGVCKGTIRSNSVKLQDMAAVEGEIYSKSLTIEQDAQFEGVSRRLDKPVEAPVSAQAFVPAKVTLAPGAAAVGAMTEKVDA